MAKQPFLAAKASVSEWQTTVIDLRKQIARKKKALFSEKLTNFAMSAIKLV